MTNKETKFWNVLRTTEGAKIIRFHAFFLFGWACESTNVQVVFDFCFLRMIYLISIRPIRVYRWTTTCIALVTISSVKRISWTVLASVPATIWIVFFNNRWFLFDYLWINMKNVNIIYSMNSWLLFHSYFCSCATAAHCCAQENIHQ